MCTASKMHKCPPGAVCAQAVAMPFMHHRHEKKDTKFVHREHCAGAKSSSMLFLTHRTRRPFAMAKSTEQLCRELDALYKENSRDKLEAFFMEEILDHVPGCCDVSSEYIFLMNEAGATTAASAAMNRRPRISRDCCPPWSASG